MERQRIVMVRVRIPKDSGFASGGGPGISALFGILGFFECMFHPFRTIRRKNTVERMREECKQRYIQEGKNPDGSCDRDFPSSCPLADVLRELGYTGEEMADIDPAKLETSIALLSSEVITDAIVSCQISRW